MSEDKKSIAAVIAEKIDDYSKSSGQRELLEDLHLYCESDKDQSATFSLEWAGGREDVQLARTVLSFLESIKNQIIEFGNEAVEQVQPHCQFFKSEIRAYYRFRIWPEKGAYEIMDRDLITR